MFLNRETDLPAFIIGIVQDTSEFPDEDTNNWKWGTIELTLGDCNRRVSFNFDTSTREERAASLYKINRIAGVINAVRDAIEKEVKSLNKRREPKEKKQKKSKN